MSGEPGAGRAPSWLDQAATRFVEELPDHFERMSWSADRLGEHQTEQLRRLLAVALQRSPYHRRRLAGLDPTTFKVGDLAALPVMTKADMMDHFDEAVTDRAVTAAAVEDHMGGLGTEPTLFLDRYITLASGGSSGRRGVFVYHRDEIVPYLAGILRAGMARLAARAGWPPPAPVPVAVVAAPTAVHATGSLPRLLGPVADLTFAPATLPFDEMVRRVQAARPAVLVGYPSVIARLAAEQHAGRLDVAPSMVIATGEQLTAELADRIEAGFGQPPSNAFGSSEGLGGSAPPGEDVFTFSSDTAIVEFVDAAERPVAAGRVADHVLVTNLVNLTQPLIRYRLDDRMVSLAPAPGHGHARATVTGRTDESFRLGGATVHPITIRSALLRHAGVGDYQVRVGASRLTVLVVPAGPFDVRRVAADVAAALAAAGSGTFPVEVETVARIDRDNRTGKARRFVICRSDSTSGGD